MTTINTIEDLIRVLDENPQWAEALRVRLLTRELIELPARFANFAAETTARFDRLESQFSSFAAETNERFAQVDQRFAQVDQRFAQVDQRFDRIDSVLERIQTDLGYMRGAHARNAAMENASAIARAMGLQRVRTLNRDELWEMTDQADTSGLGAGELDSFHRADLVMEAGSAAGVSCYVAVEVSFTVNGRDTTRAARNAELLTSFTGRPAYAAVAGLRADNRVQATLDSGSVFWYEIDASDLQAE
jgi:hypothetical protein